MAGDLIPPPSPAGRPPADPVAASTASAPALEAPQPQPEPPPPSPPARTVRAPYPARFGFVFGALAGIGACAAALAVMLLGGGGGPSVRLAENWSAWQPPTSEMLAGADAIAAHVGERYKRDDGEQLVSVQGGPLELEGLPVDVMVRPRGGAIQVLEGDGVMYVLNGLGISGSIGVGKPSQPRMRLLRRQALELVLYSFRYLDDVTMVAVMLPPAPREERAQNEAGEAQELQRQAVFFRPGDLLPQLQVPLSETLSPRTPLARSLNPAESARVDSLTQSNVFLAQLQQAQDALTYLVLEEPGGED
jgi:hypothetical protein